MMVVVVALLVVAVAVVVDCHSRVGPTGRARPDLALRFDAPVRLVVVVVAVAASGRRWPSSRR